MGVTENKLGISTEIVVGVFNEQRSFENDFFKD